MYRDFPYTPAGTRVYLPHCQYPPAKRCVCDTDEPPLTHCYHPKSTVYIWVLLVLQIFGFGQMCDDLNLLLQYHTK